MATIKAIQASSIHQIQSGQVIVDLCSVVKELVENSLDAGASSIEIRFKNNGLDSIEVQDNGNGIAESDYESIALKHYTSKLSTYDDLDKLDTFGFRGEALSSLCALSDFHIVTAVAGAGPKGTRLDFEVSGKLKGTSVVAAQKGTTVVIEKLFRTLPVRRRELEKNVKREYAKVLNLLQAYACISVNVRISVSNQPSKGKKVIAFSTKSNPTTKENILNVYGSKTLSALTALDLELEMQPSAGPTTQSAVNWTDNDGDGSRRVMIQGHMSRPVFGEGRQAPDRQMFFVNSRPCGLPQIAKAFNEVYRGFNVSQSPFVFANLVMDTNAYDVNVSPDKRTILLHDQTALLDSIKSALTKLFGEQDTTMPTSQLQVKKLPSCKQPRLLQSESSQISSPGSDSPDALYVSMRPTPVEAGNLVMNWASRDVESRQGTQDRQVPDPDDYGLEVSVEKEKLAKAVAARWAKKQVVDDYDGDEETRRKPIIAQEDRTAAEDDLQAQESIDTMSATPSGIARHVQDFNARLQSQRAKSGLQKRVTTETVELDDDSTRCGSEDNSQSSDENDVPKARFARFKSAAGPVQDAFDRMRPKRPREEEATITIGDDPPMRMVFGTPEAKRPRIHTPKTSGRSASSPLAATTSQASGLLSPESPADDDSNGVIQDMSHDVAGTEADDDKLSASHEQSDEQDDEEEDDSAPGVAVQDPFVEADESDDEYLDEADKKVREDARVAKLIAAAEEAAARPTQEMLSRASQALRFESRNKDLTYDLEHLVDIGMDDLRRDMIDLDSAGLDHPADPGSGGLSEEDESNAETKLSLTISKPDFARMRIIGQFNLGFILAVRPGSISDTDAGGGDHLFIIDQHAADEKFNFERLYATTTLTPQRLVTPKELQLSAVEAELVRSNTTSLLANGFKIEIRDPSQQSEGDEAVQDSIMTEDDDFALASIPGATAHNSRPSFHLMTLPTSKETTFTIADLEELLHLLSEAPAPIPTPTDPSSSSSSSLHSSTATLAPNSGTSTSSPSHPFLAQSSTHNHAHAHSTANSVIVRPSRVRRMLAMRACRSSIMVGKTLTAAQMGSVVRHMGEMEKPWNCPHGRPTMRHLARLGEWVLWDGEGGVSTDSRGGLGEAAVDWAAFAAGAQ